MNEYNTNAKTNKQYWDNTWAREPRLKLPSGLFVGTRNIQKLLKIYIKAGMQILEIGCAPGKMLAWVAKNLGAEVSGLDYSERGMDNTRRLLDHLGIPGDLRCEDVFQTSFEESRFDVVYSCGVIEHFDDPRRLIETHVRLAKAGGTVLITIPNLAGIYGRLQRYFNPDILALHNLDIMRPPSLVKLAPAHLVKDVRSYPFGRPSAIFNFAREMPRWLAHWLPLFLDLPGHLQPFDIPALCPILVLVMTRKKDS